MVPIRMGARVFLQMLRAIDKRLAEGSVMNARLAVAANKSRGSWVQPDGRRSSLLVDPPRSA